MVGLFYSSEFKIGILTHMRIRLVKLSDANQIALIHYKARAKLSQGFFSRVSKTFLVQYYKVILNDPNLMLVWFLIGMLSMVGCRILLRQ